MKPVIDIKNLNFHYQDNLVLEEINFKVPRNSFQTIIGPNGGGKSTLIKLMLGLLNPDNGSIHILGKNPQDSRDKVGYMPQKVSFLPDFPINIQEIVLTGCYKGLFKKPNIEDKNLVSEVLEDVGMEGLENRQVSQLSGGQLQRVFLARALVRKPEILFLDEPMASIDPQMQQSFYLLMKKLKKKMTIVLITHDVGAVSREVDGVACLNRKLHYHGSIEGVGPVLEKVYGCPLDLISHGAVPHRILGDHREDL